MRGLCTILGSFLVVLTVMFVLYVIVTKLMYTQQHISSSGCTTPFLSMMGTFRSPDGLITMLLYNNTADLTIRQADGTVSACITCAKLLVHPDGEFTLSELGLHSYAREFRFFYSDQGIRVFRSNTEVRGDYGVLLLSDN